MKGLAEGKKEAKGKGYPLSNQQPVDLLRLCGDIPQRQIRIDFRYYLANRRNQSLRIARRAYLERCAGEATLRCVHDRADFPTQIVVFCVADDADNFVAGRRFTLARFGLAEAFSQRILFPNKLRDERLVHNHWRWYRMRRRTVRYTCERIGGNLIVRGSEIAAGHEWYLHGAEEIRAYLQRVGFRLAILRRSRPVKHR